MQTALVGGLLLGAFIKASERNLQSLIPILSDVRQWHVYEHPRHDRRNRPRFRHREEGGRPLRSLSGAAPADCRREQERAPARLDGDRDVRFGGTLPEIREAGGDAQVHVIVQGATVGGYDRSSSSHFTAKVEERSVQLYDHVERAWFAYDVQVA